jgi:hypothetical protein
MLPVRIVSHSERIREVKSASNPSTEDCRCHAAGVRIEDEPAALWTGIAAEPGRAKAGFFVVFEI